MSSDDAGAPPRRLEKNEALPAASAPTAGPSVNAKGKFHDADDEHGFQIGLVLDPAAGPAAARTQTTLKAFACVLRQSAFSKSTFNSWRRTPLRPRCLRCRAKPTRSKGLRPKVLGQRIGRSRRLVLGDQLPSRAPRYGSCSSASQADGWPGSKPVSISVAGSRCAGRRTGMRRGGNRAVGVERRRLYSRLGLMDLEYRGARPAKEVVGARSRPAARIRLADAGPHHGLEVVVEIVGAHRLVVPRHLVCAAAILVVTDSSPVHHWPAAPISVPPMTPVSTANSSRISGSDCAVSTAHDAATTNAVAPTLSVMSQLSTAVRIEAHFK